MKKTFIEPEVDVLEVHVEDILTGSTPDYDYGVETPMFPGRG